MGQSVNEFALIEEIVAALGSVVGGSQVRVGPGDDASVVSMPDDAEVVSSIDALVAGVHFPVNADPKLVGYFSGSGTLDLGGDVHAPDFALCRQLH